MQGVRIKSFSGSTVIITGASSGIGREFARQLAPVASKLILAARRADRLETLASELRASNPKLELAKQALDLGNHTDLQRFCDWLDQSDFSVDLLINNSGVGDHGPFAGSEWERVKSMLRVNINALTYLTIRILPVMKKGGSGAILNVSSVAGLLPVPNSAVYAATKAYVNSFSEAIRAELRTYKIPVTALCPGPVDTEFLSRASRGTAEQRHTAPDFLIVPVEEIVRKGLEAVTHDRAQIIPGIGVNLVMRTLAFLPMFIKRLVYKTQVKRQVHLVPSDLLASSPESFRG